jgi:hypothetical protein
VIGERKRDEAAATQPALNSAKDDTIRELFGRGSRGVNNRLIAVSAAKSFQPTRGVKYGAVRMTI